ncbi:HAD-IIIC family phosphatase [Microvirga tunisiensis]|uniref:HAD-IIIC family phosphatase n=1 Tax=Microvirga tunisiensis TaxID=2108360 RepID=A0A5N7MUB2_9HYPH|nr:HAD-IIIC family phosphatase [Microvirga tunisiensis]MPR11732.1 HAD-IIIC family phosphatase [Microvirga tunisiensis]MPR30260.1 HAD-IIIC family phosphatase [Microvirga tunisiensis]
MLEHHERVRPPLSSEIDRSISVVSDRPNPKVILQEARLLVSSGNHLDALQPLISIVDCSEAYSDWQPAASLAASILDNGHTWLSKRKACVWLCSSYTIVQLAPLLRLYGLRIGIDLDVLQGNYGQLQQDILDSGSPMYAARPDFIVLCVHEKDLLLGEQCYDAAAAVEAELIRWRQLWSAIASNCDAKIIMHNFAKPAEDPFGNFARFLPGSRSSMIDRLNERLAETAIGIVSIIDCDRLSALLGKRNWFSPSYWHASRQAVSFSGLPLLAKQTGATIAAHLGLMKKCIAVDLDNTLWGGVVGEDGTNGIRIGPESSEGTAYADFQRYLLSLKNRGILLAACSKNNPADAREPFCKRSEMVLRLTDFAAFEANWGPKTESLRKVAQTLNIGLDSIVFVDDNPAEREIVRQIMPEVEVVILPEDPSGYSRTLAESCFFETSSFTPEDAARSNQYLARARAEELSRSAGTLEEFYTSLQMRADVARADQTTFARIVQLIMKSNQFNLTTHRYGDSDVRRLLADPDYLLLTFTLKDCFTDHGLVSVVGLRRHGDVLEVDLWVMSCRVIGRTFEACIVSELFGVARELGCRLIHGLYKPTAKNSMVAELFPSFGFTPVENQDRDVRHFAAEVEGWLAPTTYVSLEKGE